jgi:hypothetical protein
MEALINEEVRRPIMQFSAATLADLAALSAHEGLSKSLRLSLASLVRRISPELADMPDGPMLHELVREFEELDPSLVPPSIREAFAAESARRDPALRARLDALIARWSEVEPAKIVPFVGRGPKVQKLVSVAVPAASDRSERKPREPRAEAGSSRASSSAPKPRMQVVDERRHQWMTDAAIDRLSRYVENGLLEDVLVAAIRVAARAEFPDMTSGEIQQHLRNLQNGGKVRLSAGRWRVVLGR